MGNLIAVLAHCQRGDEVIVGKKNHIYLHEAGGISALGGVHSCQLPNQPDGSLSLEDVAGAIRWDDPHEPITRLVCLENTHNACGGVFQTPEYTRQISEFAHARGLSVHLDGARIFNAAVAIGEKTGERARYPHSTGTGIVPLLTEQVDSVTFCLSKGLCAPVGSVLCGSKPFIAKALRLRKMLGGGMRQAGILAAAGIVALEKMVDRLAEDHARARKLADGLSQIPGVSLKPGTPATNMVFLSLAPEVTFTTAGFMERLKEHNILIGDTGERSYRLVTHFWIDDAGVEKTVAAFRTVLAG